MGKMDLGKKLNKEKITYYKRTFTEMEMHGMLNELHVQIHKLQSDYLTPKFILLSFESYPLFVYALNKFMYPVLPEAISQSFSFVDKVNFMRHELEVVIIDSEKIELPEGFVKIVPSAMDRFLKEKRD